MEEIVSFLKSMFGIDDHLSILQVLLRSFVIYITGIALVRFGKKRFIGKMSAFDMIIAIILGSLLSRAITNSDEFVEILAACLFLIFLHRIFSLIAVYSDRFGDWIKGHERLLIKDGEILWDEVRKSNLSKHDLMQTIRLNAKTSDVSKIKAARLERNGDISVLMKD